MHATHIFINRNLIYGILHASKARCGASGYADKSSQYQQNKKFPKKQRVLRVTLEKEEEAYWDRVIFGCINSSCTL